MTRWIALLRGINLGARNRVSMPDLRAELTARGHADVATVVQSGNVVLSADTTEARLAADLRAVVAERFDVDTPVVVRSSAQLAAVVRDNPLPVVDGKRFQVLFFVERVDATRVEDIGDERAVVRGREVYCWHPDGLQRSKLARRLDGLPGVATARNWNTILKLHDLA